MATGRNLNHLHHNQKQPAANQLLFTRNKKQLVADSENQLQYLPNYQVSKLNETAMAKTDILRWVLKCSSLRSRVWPTLDSVLPLFCASQAELCNTNRWQFKERCNLWKLDKIVMGPCFVLYSLYLDHLPPIHPNSSRSPICAVCRHTRQADRHIWHTEPITKSPPRQYSTLS